MIALKIVTRYRFLGFSDYKSHEAAIKFQDEHLAVLEGRPSSGTEFMQSSLRFVGRTRTLLNGYYAWNTYFVNCGAGAAIGAIHADVATITDKELTTVELDKAFHILSANAKAARAINATDQTQSGDAFWYTSLVMVSPKFDGAKFLKPYTMTANDFDKNVLKGNRAVYWFGLVEVRDSDLPPGKWRITEVCGYGFANAADHICPTHNGISISD